MAGVCLDRKAACYPGLAFKFEMASLFYMRLDRDQQVHGHEKTVVLVIVDTEVIAIKRRGRISTTDFPHSPEMRLSKLCFRLASGERSQASGFELVTSVPCRHIVCFGDC